MPFSSSSLSLSLYMYIHVYEQIHLYMCECDLGPVILDVFKTYYFNMKITNMDDSVIQTVTKQSLILSQQS